MHDRDEKEEKNKKSSYQRLERKDNKVFPPVPKEKMQGQGDDPSQSMHVPEGYDIGDSVYSNNDQSNIEYGPWKISKNSESEDSVHYNMELDAELIDDTGCMEEEELIKYKKSLESSFENTYAKGEGMFFDSKKGKMVKVKWTGKINIKFAHNKNLVSNKSMHIRLRDDGKVPNTPQGKGMGYAREGYSVVYINKKVLDHAPAAEGIFKGSGLNESGQPTLQRTFAHEVFRTLSLFNPEEQLSNNQLAANGMNNIYSILKLKNSEKQLKQQLKNKSSRY